MEWFINNWDIVEIDVTEEQYEILLDFYADTKGSSYDWFGMLLSQRRFMILELTSLQLSKILN